MAKNHSRGVSLRNRGAGMHLWRDEATGDGGKRYLRRKARQQSRSSRAVRLILAIEWGIYV